MNDAGEPDAVIQTTETNGEPGFLVRDCRAGEARLQ